MDINLMKKHTKAQLVQMVMEHERENKALQEKVAGQEQTIIAAKTCQERSMEAIHDLKKDIREAHDALTLAHISNFGGVGTNDDATLGARINEFINTYMKRDIEIKNDLLRDVSLLLLGKATLNIQY